MPSFTNRKHKPYFKKKEDIKQNKQHHMRLSQNNKMLLKHFVKKINNEANLDSIFLI